MQKMSGNGLMFAEFDGHVVEYELKAGEKMVMDTGHLAAMDATCTIEIQSVPGLKNKFFGGEGFFNTVVTGPGKILVQTMPLVKLAGSILEYMPSSGK